MWLLLLIRTVWRLELQENTTNSPQTATEQQPSRTLYRISNTSVNSVSNTEGFPRIETFSTFSSQLEHQDLLLLLPEHCVVTTCHSLAMAHIVYPPLVAYNTITVTVIHPG